MVSDFWIPLCVCTIKNQTREMESEQPQGDLIIANQHFSSIANLDQCIYSQSHLSNNRKCGSGVDEVSMFKFITSPLTSIRKCCHDL